MISLRSVSSRNIVAGNHRAEARLQPVVVFLQNRVEFVIVTSRTSNSHPQKHFSGHVSNLIQNVLPLGASITLIVFVQIGSQETGRHKGLRAVRRNFVSGKLFSHELVVRFVFIKCVDDIVSVTPRFGSIKVGSKAV